MPRPRRKYNYHRTVVLYPTHKIVYHSSDREFAISALGRIIQHFSIFHNNIPRNRRRFTKVLFESIDILINKGKDKLSLEELSIVAMKTQEEIHTGFDLSYDTIKIYPNDKVKEEFISLNFNTVTNLFSIRVDLTKSKKDIKNILSLILTYPFKIFIPQLYISGMEIPFEEIVQMAEDHQRSIVAHQQKYIDEHGHDEYITAKMFDRSNRSLEKILRMKRYIEAAG